MSKSSARLAHFQVGSLGYCAVRVVPQVGTIPSTRAGVTLALHVQVARGDLGADELL